MMSNFGDWMFRNRHTGRITIGQPANRSQKIFQRATVVGVLLPRSRARDVLGETAVVALAWWGVDELVRGVNPFRRLSGVAALAAITCLALRRPRSADHPDRHGAPERAELARSGEGEWRDDQERQRMDNGELRQRFGALTTAHVADACLRVGVEVRCAPTGVQAMAPGQRVAGRIVPARHVGSVDVFLEALETAGPGDVLVVDDRGRLDESCVGDLVVLETQSAGLSGIVIWGLHRDTADILAIGLPLFSLGSIPTGPLDLGDRPEDALQRASVGEWTVGRDDVVLGDDDGVLFVPAARVAEVFTAAEGIRDTERRQADRIRGGDSLRAQVRFAEYLAAREQDPELGFREHLRGVGGEIEV